jgi:type II secretory pathway predicted ATPase ExeA
MGEPFCSVQQALRQALLDDRRHNLLFTGERGSGKTTLARQLMAQYEPLAPVARITNDEPQRSLSQQAARAFGGVPTAHATGNVEIDGLLSELERVQSERSAPALLVLDNLTPSATRVAELAELMQAAAKTRYFRVLVIGTPELGERWLRSSSSDEALSLRRIEMPALSGRQTQRYIEDWLHASLGPSSNRPLLTPDAGLLVAHRSAGNLARINRIAARMLAVAAAERRLLLSSWDAWVAPLDEAPVERTQPEPRPRDWPSQEVLEILNAERHAAGIPPRHPRRHGADDALSVSSP